MFDDGDSEDDEDESSVHAVTKSLKEQLDELDKEATRAREQEEQEAGKASADADGDARMYDDATPPPEIKGKAKAVGAGEEGRVLQGEAPPPPHPVSNGNAKPEQLHSEPGGDAPSDAVSVEGFLDASEDPLKV